jgi:chromosome segregation ATPase
MTGLTPAGRPVGSLSLDEIEEELARSERRLAAFRDASRKSHAESAAEAAALREMGTRAKEITSRPKTWRGGLKRSDAVELEALRGEIRSRAEAMSRTVEAMKSTSAEARELAERQQALSKRRAELVAQGGHTARP